MTSHVPFLKVQCLCSQRSPEDERCKSLVQGLGMSTRRAPQSPVVPRVCDFTFVCISSSPMLNRVPQRHSGAVTFNLVWLAFLSCIVGVH